MSRSSSTTRICGDSDIALLSAHCPRVTQGDFCFRMFLRARAKRSETKPDARGKFSLSTRALHPPARRLPLTRPFMTAISTVSSNQYAFTSPRDLLQNELTQEVSAGTISTGDQDALSSALDSIDSSLQSQRDTDRASGTRPSPGDLKSKVDDLIASQVSDGKLTSDQATELKNVFQNAFAKGPGSGPGGRDATSAEGSSDTSSTSSDTDLQKLLADFLSSLQNSTSQTSSYSGSGQTQSASAALLFDYQS